MISIFRLYRQFSAVAVMVVLALLLSACAGTEHRRSTGQVIDDASIATRVNAKLLEDDFSEGLSIDVEVDRSKVQLNGFVDSQAQIDKAGELTRSVEGVTQVSNNLQIAAADRSAGEWVDDTTVLARVKAELTEDELAPARYIDVEVNRGVVSLGGHVSNNAQRQAAEAAAARVKGVKRVINNLDIQ